MGYVSSLSTNVTAYEPITTSGEVAFTGLGNGTDFQEIIDVSISAESYQKEAYEAQKAETEYIISLLEQLESEIDSLNTTLNSMDDPGEFCSMSGSSTSDAVDIRITDDASAGSHTVIVDQLAQNDVWVNTENGYASPDTVIADTATTLELSHNGEPISIDVPAGTTLEGLVTLVNGNVDAKDAIEADILYDGNSYYFVLKSKDSGADNALTITDTGTLNGFDIANFTNTQTGQNSRIKVDGFPADSDEWIERDSNSVDDVVDGITFELKEPTSAEGAIITIDYDTDAMAETITTFVAEVNQIILDIQVLTGRVTQEESPDEESYTVDSYALDIIYSDIKNIMSSSGQGFIPYDTDTGGDTYNALSQIGFSTDVDEGSDTFGQLTVDEEELETALDNDPEAVAQLFSAKGTAESDSEDFQVISVIENVTPPGEHAIEYTISNGMLTSATIDGEDAAIDGWTILGTSSDSSGLYISIIDQTDGTYSGTARVKQGKIGEMSDALDNVSDEEIGSLTLLIENYEQSITSLDNQIYNEEKRLETLEASLTRKYAALDATLSYYENQSSLLSSQLAQLD